MKSLHLVLATLLLATAGGLSAAADAPVPVPAPVAPQQAEQQIETLDEIWVRGKHLSDVIENAEDEFFKLYNKLNKDSAYDVLCGQMSLNKGSMIMVRRCMPGFIVSNYYDARSQTLNLGVEGMGTYSGGRGCGGSMMSYRDTNGDPYYMSSCSYTGYTSYGGYSPGPYNVSSFSAPGADRPPLELTLMERRPAYARNVVQVVKSDPRLLAMVKNLGSLYDEMELTQKNYIRVKAVSQPARRSGKTGAGPRAL
jgi:hypothetical protein